ncbi:MAG: Valine--tRNA ligase [Alphaproteobacteria bacterium MarineAlpha3_Bin5]|nr:valine--tRNA ligase [Magnetovibrio sp.]PPR77141.1 MAG: Valine--tRNA ligase [Alphaproteobacteria bacterium MarineAlpha3_Bin5]
MLDKIYQPHDIEKKIYNTWEQDQDFASGKILSADPFSIVIPPPNVTGNLHMGHALNNTLQDIIIRYSRMKGRDSLWQPGTDHAGIATQMVVERQLEQEGKTRHDLGREKFIKRVWEWKAESGGNITKQLRRIGASCDWARERFTMDEGLSRAVRKVFVQLYRESLIYRDKRLVNWDPKLHTAISDLEVEQREVNGNMWYFKYPVNGQPDTFVTVGTTRPETIFGDTGIAVHPDDDRYKQLVGKYCFLPIVERKLPIVADVYADPKKGTGAVKITPAHDFGDFEVGKIHNLKMINIFDQNACLNKNVPETFQGLDRYVAREKVVEAMRDNGFLHQVEKNPMTIPYGDRSGVVIEPWLMDQWFVDAKTLAGPAITAVEQGKTNFVPKQWENTYYDWMRNIQPWCISRQIWWGHQIPAWFGTDGEIFVAETAEEAYAEASRVLGEGCVLEQDPDVLDTWFSSALWPFSTLGWPEKTGELNRYYPTKVLVTGFDIIFFWVARMMMMGIHFMGSIPFETVYIHALVRDEKGQKMSKSKGNVIDPLHLIEKYGADALRFTLTAFAAQGRDVKLSESRVEGYRNFCTKLWNAARFCEMNKCQMDPSFDPALVSGTLNRWIVGKTSEACNSVAMAIENFQFNNAAAIAYQFTWGTFCDWFLEFAKPIFMSGGTTAQEETRKTAGWVLENILIILHPIMPFITEELWMQMNKTDRKAKLIATPWPRFSDDLLDEAANAEIDWVIRLISQVRAVRAELRVPPKAKITLILKDSGYLAETRMQMHSDLIKQLAKLSSLSAVDDQEVPAGGVQDVLDEATIILLIGDVVDLRSEKLRIEREILRQEKEVRYFESKLSNEKFLSNAPEGIIEIDKEKLSEARLFRDKLLEAQARIVSSISTEKK